MEGISIIQMAFTAGAGLLGVGAGIGFFKSTVQQIQKDLDCIRKKQQRLRGEDNGGVPVYMTKTSCESLRNQCAMLTDNKISDVSHEVVVHTRSIKALDNFARWWMQEKGLRIDEINQILNME